jgi:hypothetical protein
VDDTHIRKRKLNVGPRKEKGKKQRVMDKSLLGSDEFTLSLDEGRNPPYQASNFSTSASSDDNDDIGDGGGSGGYRITPSQPPIQFVGMKYLQFFIHMLHIIFLISLTLALHFSGESHYTHTTQDTDHGAPHSQRGDHDGPG